MDVVFVFVKHTAPTFCVVLLSLLLITHNSYKHTCASPTEIRTHRSHAICNVINVRPKRKQVRARCKRRVCIGTPVCYSHRDGLAVKQSTIPSAGKGLFVTKDIKKNSVIGSYEGEMRTLEQNYARYQGGNAPYAASAPPGVVDAACRRGILSMANASKQRRHTNAKLSNRVNSTGGVNVRSTKKIKRGSEVILYYGKSYWKTAKNAHHNTK